MAKVIVTILMSTLFATGCSKLQEGSKAKIIINPEFINSFSGNEFQTSVKDTGTFNLVQQFDVRTQDDSYKVELLEIPDWGDPGDFHRLRISDSQDQVLIEETNFNGWVKFGQNNSVPTELVKRNSIDSDMALLLDLRETKQLFLFSWVYANTPGLLTIIDFTEDALIIFHKEFELYKIDFDESGHQIITGSPNFEDSTQINLTKMEVL